LSAKACHNGKEAFFNHLVTEFDKLVDELIPAEEAGFKNYAKENMNPFLYIYRNQPDPKLSTAIKF
jgi:hypothetical protein